MKKSNESLKKIFICSWKILVTVIIVVSFVFVWKNHLNILLHVRYLNKGNLMMYGVYLCTVCYFLHIFGGYKIGLSRKSNLLISQTVAFACVNFVEILITILMVGRVKHIRTIIGSYILLSLFQTFVISIFSIMSIDLYRHIFPPYTMLQIYGEHKNTLQYKMNLRRDRYLINGQISCDESLKKIAAEIEKYDAVLINDVSSKKRNKILKLCFEMNKRVYFTPKISDIFVKNAEELNIFDTPLFLCRNEARSLVYCFFKRVFDIIISSIGILITSPIMLITAAAIHFYDKGPVFYCQTRCTIDGKEFQIRKFRSMIVDAEKNGRPVLAKEQDTRITPVGKFIRATRIDELPQFFNILQGDMSIVGPRPERPEIIKKYKEQIPEFSYRTKMKAGLTGYAQIYGKYNTSPYDKLKLDLMYINRAGLLLDFRLILLTVKVIFLKESTEGISNQ